MTVEDEVYESAVRERRDFRNAYCEEHEKLKVAVAALEEVVAQKRNLRPGDCDPVRYFEGLQDGLVAAVNAAQGALAIIVPPNNQVERPGNPVRSDA